MSRTQLLLAPTDEGRLSVKNVGRAALLHNGAPATEVFAKPGDTLVVGNAFVFLVERRATGMAELSAYGAATFAFGQRDPHGIVGESPRAWELRERLAVSARADRHVLLVGESGSGKELAAQAIHALSSRRNRPLVCRNAATFPATLVDAELFGNSKNYPNVGSPERVGLIGEADGASLFLDEIGELPTEQQAHLLRVLDGGEYQRLGESRGRRSDFRLYAATNRSPDVLKHDFLARFAVRVTVPGLNERRADIPLLVNRLLSDFRRSTPDACHRFFGVRGDPSRPRMDPSLVDVLIRHEYTHHVRELERLLWLAITTSTGDYLAITEDVEDELSRDPPRRSKGRPRNPDVPNAEQVAQALQRAKGSKTEAARLLGLKSRYALYRLIDRYRMEEPG